MSGAFFIYSISGECSGALESVEAVSSVDDCIEACISVAECSWWNFDTSNGFCTLLSSCDDVTYQCPSCTHGSRVCGDNGPSEGKLLCIKHNLYICSQLKG